MRDTQAAKGQAIKCFELSLSLVQRFSSLLGLCIATVAICNTRRHPPLSQTHSCTHTHARKHMLTHTHVHAHINIPAHTFTDMQKHPHTHTPN